MLKAILNISESLNFEVQGESEYDVFKQIARVQEIFSVSKCGKCNSVDIKFSCRLDSTENEWTEIQCSNMNCRAKLVYGKTKKGDLIFPKIRWSQLSPTQQEHRKDEQEYAETHNGYLPHGGWFIYKKKP